jgi:hypothetical protein
MPKPVLFLNHAFQISSINDRGRSAQETVSTLKSVSSAGGEFKYDIFDTL